MTEHIPIPIKVKDMNVQAYWSLDLKTPTCELCHEHLMKATQEEILNRTITNNIVIGTCQHGFHEECFNSWTKAGSKYCPVDHTDWKEADSTDVSVIWNKVGAS